MSVLDEQAFTNAKREIINKYHKKGGKRFNDLLEAKRGGEAVFLKFIFPDLQKKGFSRQVLASLEKDVSLLSRQVDQVLATQKASDNREDAKLSESVVEDDMKEKPPMLDHESSSGYEEVAQIEVEDPEQDEDPPFQDSSDMSEGEEGDEPDLMGDEAPIEANDGTSDEIKQKDIEAATNDLAVIKSAGPFDPTIIHTTASEGEEEVKAKDIPVEKSLESSLDLPLIENNLPPDADRQDLINEIKNLQKVVTDLRLENQALSMKMEALQSKDESTQIEALQREISDLNDMLAQKEEQFINEKEEMREQHNMEIEELRKEQEQFDGFVGRVRGASSALQPDSEKIQKNQERLEELQKKIMGRVKDLTEELSAKDQYIADLEEEVESGMKKDLRKRTRSIFQEEWDRKLNASFPKDLHTIKNVKDQIDMVSEFLNKYKNSSNWLTQSRQLGDKLTTVYNLNFGGREIFIRFSMLMPSMMLLGQAIGIQKSTMSFASQMNSGDEKKKAFFAEVCGDMYNYLQRRAHTPSYEFVFSFLTTLFDSYDAVQHLAGRRIDLKTIKQEKLPEFSEVAGNQTLSANNTTQSYSPMPTGATK